MTRAHSSHEWAQLCGTTVEVDYNSLGDDWLHARDRVLEEDDLSVCCSFLPELRPQPLPCVVTGGDVIALWKHKDHGEFVCVFMFDCWLPHVVHHLDIVDQFLRMRRATLDDSFRMLVPIREVVLYSLTELLHKLCADEVARVWPVGIVVILGPVRDPLLMLRSSHVALKDLVRPPSPGRADLAGDCIAGQIEGTQDDIDNVREGEVVDGGARLGL